MIEAATIQRFRIVDFNQWSDSITFKCPLCDEPADYKDDVSGTGDVELGVMQCPHCEMEFHLTLSGFAPNLRLRHAYKQGRWQSDWQENPYAEGTLDWELFEAGKEGRHPNLDNVTAGDRPDQQKPPKGQTEFSAGIEENVRWQLEHRGKKRPPKTESKPTQPQRSLSGESPRKEPAKPVEPSPAAAGLQIVEPTQPVHINGVCVVFDFMNLLVRCHHVPGHTVGTMLKTVQRCLAQFNPAAVAFAGEGGRGFRHELHPGYKAKREEPTEELLRDIDIAKQALDAIGWPLLSAAGYEADDVIATVAREMMQRMDGVFVVSTDKDLWQLIPHNVAVYDPFGVKGFIRPQHVKEKFGIRPDQVHAYLSLAGDSSDSVPGVKGVGAKTAAELLNEFETLNAIKTAAASETEDKRLLKVGRDLDGLEMSQQLVTLCSECPLPTGFEEWPPTNPRPNWRTKLEAIDLRQAAAKLTGLFGAERTTESRLVLPVEGSCKDDDTPRDDVINHREDVEPSSSDPAGSRADGLNRTSPPAGSSADESKMRSILNRQLDDMFGTDEPPAVEEPEDSPAEVVQPVSQENRVPLDDATLGEDVTAIDPEPDPHVTFRASMAAAGFELQQDWPGRFRSWQADRNGERWLVLSQYGRLTFVDSHFSKHTAGDVGFSMVSPDAGTEPATARDGSATPQAACPNVNDGGGAGNGEPERADFIAMCIEAGFEVKQSKPGRSGKILAARDGDLWMIDPKGRVVFDGNMAAHSLEELAI